MLWNLECPSRIEPKEKYVRILDGPLKNKEFMELRSDFEFSRLKCSTCIMICLLCIHIRHVFHGQIDHPCIYYHGMHSCL